MQYTSSAQQDSSQRLMHHRPIPLRLTEDEHAEALRLARGEDRSASNFALVVFRLGIAEFKRLKGAVQ